MDSSEVSRKQQPFDNPATRDRAFSRDHGDYFWQTGQQTHHFPLSSGGEHSATPSSNWIHVPRQQIPGKDRACVRPGLEDDSVFEEVSRPDRGFPFKSPGTAVGFADRCPNRSGDRSSTTLLSSDASPRRPALRSQSNVEQSPNKAELDAMAHYKYLRSYSEHISDPQRLVEQRRLISPADCDQLQGMRRIAVSGSSSFTNSKDPEIWNDRHRGVRRTLFQDADEMAAGDYDSAEWQQQGCHTYPPPVARRQSFSSARDLRRSQSWIRAMDSEDRHAGVTMPRQPGDLDVTLECTGATPSSVHPHGYSNPATPGSPQHPHILRRKIETYIQQILKNHLQIRPSSTSQADMDLWIAQATEIERLTEEASQLIGSLSEHNRSVFDVVTGSVVIKVNCCTLLGVLDLWEKFESGALQRQVSDLFAGDRLLQGTGCGAVHLGVSLCCFQYTACLEELGGRLAPHTAAHSPGLPRLDSASKECKETGAGELDPMLEESGYVPHPCDVTPFDAQHPMSSPAWFSPTQNFCSPSSSSKRHGDCSARKAFSELNLSDGELTPTSPTSKKFFDSFQKENSILLSPLVSPYILPSPRWRTSVSGVTKENEENNN